MERLRHADAGCELHPERSVTLLAAMQLLDGTLLLSADSGVAQEGGILLPRPKLAKRADRPIAWWFTGLGNLGVQFRDWIQSEVDWNSVPDWRALATTVVPTVNRINREARESYEQAGLKREFLGPGDFVDVLIVGFIGGNPQILSVDWRGGWQLLLPDHPYVFAGGGADLAYVAYGARQRPVKSDHSPELLLDIMRQTIGFGAKRAGLRGPIRMLRIAADQPPTDISDDEFRHTFPFLF